MACHTLRAELGPLGSASLGRSLAGRAPVRGPGRAQGNGGRTPNEHRAAA